jgi:hypothetical protein
MQTRKLIVIVTLILIATMACKMTDVSSDVTNAATDTPAVDYKATENTLQTMVAEQANVQATAQAQATSLAAEAYATATAAALLAQATPTATTASATRPPAVEPTFTPAVDSVATQQAQDFQDTLQGLLDDGVISSTEGDYYPLDDFSESWAQLGYYQWWDTGYSAENFVLSTDVTWESASDKANWPEAGCGIVFSEDSESDHNLVYLSLDGYGRLIQVNEGEWKNLASQFYGKLSIPDGDAKIMLVVNDKRISFYVNGERVANAYDGSLNEGKIALTLLSGTNKDFGTRCTMSNTDLLIFK